MPRRRRQAVVLPGAILLAAAAAVGRWPRVGTGSNSQASPGGIFVGVAAEFSTTTAPPSSQARRGAWGATPRSWVSRRRREGVNVGRSQASSSIATARGADGGYDPSFAPLWLRARGGAGTRVDGRPLSTEEKDKQEEQQRQEEEGEEGEDDDGAQEEQEVSSAEDDDEGCGIGDVVDDTSEDQSESLDADSGAKQVDGQDAAGEAAGVSPAETPTGSSVAQELDMKKVLPALIKQGVVFFMGTWLAKKLSPAVEGQVRTARIIYTTYLILSQALCMYLRYLIWKKDDGTEIEVPPPQQLKKMMEGVGGAGAGAGEEPGAGAGGATTAADGAGGAASALGPMLDKMMTSKTPVKKYDMNTVQSMRRSQFWASLFMCYTHLRKGMIKPMMLQVSFGILALFDHPLFKIYVLGQEAEGDLARPFKKQGLMTTLQGPMEGMAAKAEAARAAAESSAAADAAAASSEEEEEEEEEEKAGADGARGERLDEDGDGAMPDIELLSDADESE